MATTPLQLDAYIIDALEARRSTGVSRKTDVLLRWEPDELNKNWEQARLCT